MRINILTDRTGRNCHLPILAPLSSVTYLLLLLILLYFQWETLPLAYIELFSTFLSHTSNCVFTRFFCIFLTAAVRKEDTAIAICAFYISISLGVIAVQNCVLQGTLRGVLLMKEVMRSVVSRFVIRSRIPYLSRTFSFDLILWSTPVLRPFGSLPSDIQSIVVDVY